MTILHIETSTHVCSVALSDHSTCIFSTSNHEGQNHAAMLSVFIQDAWQILKSQKKRLDAVAVSSGPGSYTGLRIGVSTAKGICYGLDIPLISVSTLELMAETAKKQCQADFYIPMIDARRMEVYDAVYNHAMHLIRADQADIITEHSFDSFLNENSVCFFGNGSEKCRSLLQSPNAHFLENINPVAAYMIPLAIHKYTNQLFESVAYFEPFYLKEFQATTPKKSF